MEAQHSTSHSIDYKNFNPNCVSEIQLFYKTEIRPVDRPVISSPEHAYLIFKHYWDKSQIQLREEFKMLLLNQAHRVLGIVSISSGGVSSTTVDPKLVFSTALVANASSLVVAHNHPSGNLIPSESDIKMTNKLYRGGLLLDISVLDHLILTNDGYCSMKDEGYM